MVDVGSQFWSPIFPTLFIEAGALNKPQSSPIQTGFYYINHTQDFCVNNSGMLSHSISKKKGQILPGLFL